MKPCRETGRIQSTSHHTDELKELEYSGVQEIVATIIPPEGIHNGAKEVSIDDVAVVELVLEAHDATHEPQGPQHQEGELGTHQHQHPAQQVLVQHVVLDMVRVVLHAERQQLHDQSQQLCGLPTLCKKRTYSRLKSEQRFHLLMFFEQMHFNFKCLQQHDH